jgi:hypothetical protein
MSIQQQRNTHLKRIGFKQLQFISTLTGTYNIDQMNYEQLSKAIGKTANTQPNQKNYTKIMAARIILHGQRAMAMMSEPKL